jgi:hypothetical protein
VSDAAGTGQNRGPNGADNRSTNALWRCARNRPSGSPPAGRRGRCAPQPGRLLGAIAAHDEAFASVAIHPMRDLDIGSVVVNGGAIAMGDPPASSISTYQPKKSAQQDPLLDVPSLRVHSRVSPAAFALLKQCPVAGRTRQQSDLLSQERRARLCTARRPLSLRRRTPAGHPHRATHTRNHSSRSITSRPNG